MKDNWYIYELALGVFMRLLFGPSWGSLDPVVICWLL